MTDACFAGVDVGASATKAVVVDNSREIAGSKAVRSSIDFSGAADTALKDACLSAGISSDMIRYMVSTGYGRQNVAGARETKTEISCHAKGCYHYFPDSIAIIDIGGQDNKIIKLDAAGRRVSFKMNRKCAAGTGAFLEEMAARLGIALSDMNQMALEADGVVKLGSFCTVFSATEVLENIRAGKKAPDIVKGIYFSMIKRVLEMDSLTGNVVMTGGVVAYNSCIIEMTGEMTGVPILVPPLPQFTGAFGAALYAQELFSRTHGKSGQNE